MVIGANTCSYDQDERQFNECKLMYGNELQKLVQLNCEQLAAAYTYHSCLACGQQCPSRGKFPYTDDDFCAFCFSTPEEEVEVGEDDETSSETEETARQSTRRQGESSTSAAAGDEPPKKKAKRVVVPPRCVDQCRLPPISDAFEMVQKPEVELADGDSEEAKNARQLLELSGEATIEYEAKATAKLLRRIVQAGKRSQSNLSRNIDRTTDRLVRERLNKKVHF